MPNPPRVLLVATAALTMGGCAAAPAEPTGSSVAPTSVPATSVRLVGETPVITHEQLGGTASAVLPSAFSLEGDTYHAWVVAFGADDGDQRPIHLTSTDAIAWEIANDDLVGELGVEYTPPGPIPSSMIARGDDGWMMHFWGTQPPENDRANIWLATADDPLGPWTAAAEPAISHGPIEAWDGRGVDFPSVVATDDGYLMLYGGAGFGGPPSGSIGVATSADGLTWTKGDEPVIAPGFCGAFDSVNASQGRLLPLPEGGYRLPYGGYDGGDAGATVGLASSPDGLTWTCLTPEPILTAADIPGSAGIHSIAATLDVEGRPLLLIESLIEVGADVVASEVWLARIDGLP